MILIDALYINNGGGKILLDYLIEKIENENLNIHFLLDQRIQNKHPFIVNNQVTYLQASLLNRHKFYKTQAVNFSKILCFGNIPPTKKVTATVYTYFHQKLFLEIPKNTSPRDKIIFKIKTKIFMVLRKNTNFWIVQTESMKIKLGETLQNFKMENILTIPFYPNFVQKEKNREGKTKFLYVSSGAPHKNHYKLIEGFKIFYNSNKMSELHLTVGIEFKDLFYYIENTILEGIPIINHGFVKRNMLQNIYCESSYLIYPSLSESFGLGLVEAIECGCDILGANLPYTFAVCEPSLVFDPNNQFEISNAFRLTTHNNLKPTKQKIFNQIDDLLLLLKETK